MTDKKTHKTPSKPADQKTGFVAIIGAPNAGKSTFLNQLLGEKLSIVSHKAQTTRMRVLGILTEGDTQIGLIDTPGIFTPKGRLDKAMVSSAWESMDGADVIVLLVDAAIRQPDQKTDAILDVLKKRDQKVTLVLNKVDRINRLKLLPMIKLFHEMELFDEIYMISALNGDGVDDVKNYLKSRMPQGDFLYPEDQLTDLPERLFAAEITREQIYHQLHEELPYIATVLPEAWEERKDGSVTIRQTIVVTRPNHRAIVLGKNGAQIKSIGQRAREELTTILDRPIHLFLDVKVDEDWQDKSSYYTLFGLNHKA